MAQPKQLIANVAVQIGALVLWSRMVLWRRISFVVGLWRRSIEKGYLTSA